MKSLEDKILIVKDNKMASNRQVLIRLINKIQKECGLSREFESYIQNLSSYLDN